MAGEVLLVWDEGEFLALLHSETLRGEVAAVGEHLAADARGRAPRGAGRDGHMADTIHAETLIEAGGWAAHVGWDQLHAYARFPEKGTRYQPGQHFLLHAADRYAHP